MITEKVAALRRTALFGELAEPELRALAERAVQQRLGRGETLFVAGEEARGLYVVVEGAVRASRVGLDGREQVIHVEHAGATLAEVPVFDDGPYPSNATADLDSTLLFIDKRDVKRLCLEHPKIALAALKLLAARVRRTASLVEALSLQEVDQRLAALLVAEAQSQGVKTRTGVALELTLTNQQIAARIGSVREVVSRALARLQHSGLISVKGRMVTISDVDALKRYAEEKSLRFEFKT
jgi:CRP/FNR family transcriptional regulator